MRGVRNSDAVTVYSYDKQKECFLRQVFCSVSCFFKNEYSSAGANKQGGARGLEYDGSVILRIFTDKDIAVKAGDMIALYKCSGDSPPPDAHKVLGTEDNRRAQTPRMRHWKVVCR